MMGVLIEVVLDYGLHLLAEKLEVSIHVHLRNELLLRYLLIVHLYLAYK